MAPPSPILSSISRQMLENLIERQIRYFYSLSKNLTYKEELEGGRVYRELEDLFLKGYKVNEGKFISGGGLNDQSWPELVSSEKSSIRFAKGAFPFNKREFHEMTLLQYLQCLNVNKRSSLAAKTASAAKPLTSPHKPNYTSSSSSLFYTAPIPISGSVAVKPYVCSFFLSGSSALQINVPQASSSAPSRIVRVDSPFPWGVRSKLQTSGFSSEMPSLSLGDSISTDDDLANEESFELQKAIDLFRGCTYYQTQEGKEAILKKGKIIACQEGVQFYSPDKNLPCCYRCDDGSLSTSSIKNVKCEIHLDSEKDIRMVLKRLKGIPLVEECSKDCKKKHSASS